MHALHYFNPVLQLCAIAVSTVPVPLHSHVPALVDGLEVTVIQVSVTTCACMWLIPSSIVDINECGSNNGGCASTCHNTAGSYYCSCPSGCTLNSNGHACNGKLVHYLERESYTRVVYPALADINECAGTNNCAHNCHNTGSCGGYYCSCNTGYSLNGNGYSCDSKQQLL